MRKGVEFMRRFLRNDKQGGMTTEWNDKPGVLTKGVEFMRRFLRNDKQGGMTNKVE